MNLSFFIGLFTLVTLFFCQVAFANVEYLEKLEHAKLLWGTENPKKYSYTLKSGGVFGYTLYNISINNGKCKSKSKFSMGKTTTSWKATSCHDLMIGDIFDKIRTQIIREYNQIKLEFNLEFGYPTYFYVEPKTVLEDQNWYVEISNFKVKKSNKLFDFLRHKHA